ncbi:MAG TPA: allantoate amidohydrolase [Bryobacteraceae bacterium]
MPLSEKVIARCLQISLFSEAPGEITRTFLCDAMHGCHRLLTAWMEELGMTVAVDPAGNLRGLYAGQGAVSRRLLIGSHLDTVPDAGMYDGVLGVVLGIALVESLAGQRFSYEIEIAGFSEEEGVRFGVPFIGSRALAGTLDGAVLETTDETAVSIRSAISHFGLDPSRLDKGLLHPNTFAYLEFHIEQGPVLQSANQPLGIVERIAGQSRLTVQFNGRAAHAGATPMHQRRDALAAAAEWIVAVERHAAAVPGLVATVGRIEAKPGASNVIPASVMATLDVRHPFDEPRVEAVEKLLATAREIARRRGLRLAIEPKLDQNAVAMHSDLIHAAERAMQQGGFTAPRLVSGAGHDAMIIAAKIPSVMIFLRSPGGISHHPDETVYPEDVSAALLAGRHFLDECERLS